MKGKTKKRKVGKVLLLGLSFILTIVITFSVTMAWFFDSDWASKDITMAGRVGIELRDYNEVVTSGEGALNFKISTDKAFPGQSVQVSAEVHNNSSSEVIQGIGTEGAPCYIRASFIVYSDIPEYQLKVRPDDDTTSPTISTETITNGEGEEEEVEYIYDTTKPITFNVDKIYEYLAKLIKAQNALNDTVYQWNYYKAPAKKLSDSGISNDDIKYYLDGKTYILNETTTKYHLDGDDSNPGYTDAEMSALKDDGYYYLCYKANQTFTEKIPTPDTTDDATVTTDSTVTTTAAMMKPLAIGTSDIFLMNSTFIIPWTLDNYFADKTIRVLVKFQAIQTFIPQIGSDGQDKNGNAYSDGFISTMANNQLLPSQCTYTNNSVITVFNSCSFAVTQFSCPHCDVSGSISGFTEDSEATDVCASCGEAFGMRRCVGMSESAFESLPTA